MSHNHRWTDEERDIIRRDFQHTLDSCAQVARFLSHMSGDRITAFAVRGQVTSMGIAKTTDRHPWSTIEDDRLRDLMPQFCARRVARMMHRSLNSVVVRSKRLSISRRTHDGWFTKREVMEILGHDHKWVQRRIDSGALRASYHHEHRPAQKGMACWHITQRDLRDFIRTYPEELVGCNLDIMAIVEILAGINGKPT